MSSNEKTRGSVQWVAIILLSLLVAFATRLSRADSRTADQQQLFDIYKELVEIDTTDDTSGAAKAMAARLIAAGVPAQDVRVLVHPGNARKANLVARLRGDGTLKPILLLAHLDVVAALKQDWSPDLDPFKLIERDGYYYGRGTLDDKARASILVANFIRYRREHLKLRRDVILALTADEEGGDFNGAQWLLEQHRDLVDAQFGLNEGGFAVEHNGRMLFNGVQATEKGFSNYRLEVLDKGGHSSLPAKDNAIYRLARGLDRLAAFEFPVNLNDVTRTFLTRSADVEGGRAADVMRAVVQSNGTNAQAVALLSQTPSYGAMLRTTCVATMLEGGHAINALPQRAAAYVNCRILPQESAEDVRRTVVQVLADERITVTTQGQDSPKAPISPLTPEVLQPIEDLTHRKWARLPTLPLMSPGASDSRFFRAGGIPMYGVSGLFVDIADVRMHGRDERVGVKAFYDAQEFLYELVKRYAMETKARH